MEIRKAILPDIENGLLEIFIDGYRFHQMKRPDKFLDKKEDELKEKLRKLLDNGNVIVIDIGDKIIGYASYQIKEKNKKILWIDELIISEDYRKKGYGKLIMNELENISKKEECSSIEFCCWQFNKNAQEMYEHLGYEIQLKIYEKQI